LWLRKREFVSLDRKRFHRDSSLRYAEPVKHRCPICKKPTDSATDAEFPFCSERCQLHDLGNWATEKYTISEPAFDDSLFDDEGSTADSRTHSSSIKDEHKN
jgi:uncharacterized protein